MDDGTAAIGSIDPLGTGVSLSDTNYAFASASTILMILAMAFFTMGVMDYYSATEIEDKEQDREMLKMGNHSKDALIGGPRGIEDSMPYNGALDTENLVSRPPQPGPGERA